MSVDADVISADFEITTEDGARRVKQALATTDTNTKATANVSQTHDLTAQDEGMVGTV